MTDSQYLFSVFIRCLVNICTHFLLPYECTLVSASRAALAELLLCDDDDDDVEGEPWRALLIQESTLTPPALPRDPSASEPEDESAETQREQSHTHTLLLTGSCTKTHAHTHTPGGVYVSMEV